MYACVSSIHVLCTLVRSECQPLISRKPLTILDKYVDVYMDLFLITYFWPPEEKRASMTSHGYSFTSQSGLSFHLSITSTRTYLNTLNYLFVERIGFTISWKLSRSMLFWETRWLVTAGGKVIANFRAYHLWTIFSRCSPEGGDKGFYWKTRDRLPCNYSGHS